MLLRGFSHSLSISNAEDSTVRLWPRLALTLPQKTASFPYGTVLRGHTGPVSCCSFSTDGGSLATGGRDRVSHESLESSSCVDPQSSPAPLVPRTAHFPSLLCQPSCSGYAHVPSLLPFFLELCIRADPGICSPLPMVLTTSFPGTLSEPPLLGREDASNPCSHLLLLCLSP